MLSLATVDDENESYEKMSPISYFYLILPIVTVVRLTIFFYNAPLYNSGTMKVSSRAAGLTCRKIGSAVSAQGNVVSTRNNPVNKSEV
jgi:hypothetical protein